MKEHSDKQQESDMTITLRNDRKAKAWLARFDSHGIIGTTEWVPLPWSNQADVLDVARDLWKRFPAARIVGA